MKKFSKNRGSTLVEVVFYILLMVIVLSAIVNSLYSLGTLYKGMQSTRAITTSAQTALERITRETRDSLSVDVAQSVLDVDQGTLMLNTTDNAGNPATIKFSLVNGAVRVEEDGEDMGALTPASALVTRLYFHHIVSSMSEAVKIEMTVESGTGANYKSKILYSTIVLRGSYPFI
jgi:hypothetical protein